MIILRIVLSSEKILVIVISTRNKSIINDLKQGRVNVCPAFYYAYKSLKMAHIIVKSIREGETTIHNE